MPWQRRAALGAALVVAAGAQARERHVLAWPPTRYASAEIAVFRSAVSTEALAVRVLGRGIDVTVDVPTREAARISLPERARCAVGVDDCAIVVERVVGEGDVEVVLQSPVTAGVADTLLATAHDTVRIPRPALAVSQHVVVAWPSDAAEFPESVSFASIVPVNGTADVEVVGACAVSASRLVLPQVLTIACAAHGDDLSGASVRSDAPVLVLSGNAVAPVPDEAGLSGDLLLDVSPAPPSGASTYLVPPLPRAATHAGRGDVVRLVAAADVSVRLRDERGGDETRALRAGDVLDVDMAGSDEDRTLRVDADAPLLAWHLAKSRALRGSGDSAAVALVPRERFAGGGRFFVPDGYGEGTVLVVVKDAGGTVTLDGNVLTGFTPAPGGGLEWTRVAVSAASVTGSVHELRGDVPLAAWVFGQGGYKAHGSIAVEGGDTAFDVLRGAVADALEWAATVSERRFRDPTPGALLFWKVGDDAAVLLVSRCEGSTCLEW